MNQNPGLRAAKAWLVAQNFQEFRETGSDPRVDLYGIGSHLQAQLEVAIKIETARTIATQGAKDLMYSLAQWREASRGKRRILLFVPFGLSQTGRELLGLYDEVHEFNP